MVSPYLHCIINNFNLFTSLNNYKINFLTVLNYKQLRKQNRFTQNYFLNIRNTKKIKLRCFKIRTLSQTNQSASYIIKNNLFFNRFIQVLIASIPCFSTCQNYYIMPCFDQRSSYIMFTEILRYQVQRFQNI
ncbi:hypothetical protein IMG5_197000 [Ichthyophthirius multifiliis]|uniref:Uncharacterized protein n=1 Tax=Ichthyophthirius multifiliis TaxID=5932 RepID=G0R588_ICHMU|nr:hypothetical protein IMG5_197000 [Ichthyophthirius multifiliis]EGR27365.1 hypothetical protein IMG5_197000 [Ichthyophthirius multifiliis]|eukprot:XP_004024249.1 hypothetical protein IMG5_197000 [Ichthyophthirius multifiliis]